MGDFTGFSFGNWHSSKNDSVTVLRVSDGDRYTEELHPEIKDRTAEVPGLDGEYYFGSDYGPKTIDISIAFDSLTEGQFRTLRKVFGTRQVQELIFDERPYKKYLAKISSPIELSYICFDEPIKETVTIDGIKWEGSTEHTVIRNTNQKQRIYKGEGKITFICYFPFAKSVYRVLPEGADWAFSSGILTNSVRETNNIDTCVIDGENIVINVYNPGDMPTGFRLYLPKTALSGDVDIAYKDTGSVTAGLYFNPITFKENDIGLLIDTNNGLAVGVSSVNNDLREAVTSGNLYNSYIKNGFFFKLEPSEIGERQIILHGVTEVESDNQENQETIDVGENNVQIYYDYLYF